MFSGSETLSSEYKYYCENCCSKQEATKRLRIKRLPLILALHLKRFKYQEHLHRHTKLSHRVVFPWELKLFNTVRERRGRLISVPMLHCSCLLNILIMYLSHLTLLLSLPLPLSHFILYFSFPLVRRCKWSRQNVWPHRSSNTLWDVSTHTHTLCEVILP